jgi:uncharacterized protein YndB with AHSA1/START domain
MKTQSKPVMVRVARRFTAPPERVFDAWLDAKRAGNWMFATPDGEMVRAEIDARVGGKFVFTDRRRGEDVEHTGEYLEIDRPRRLVFTFGLPKVSPDFDRVTVEIVPQGTGCELTLTHEMKREWAEYKDRTEDGWSKMLGELSARVA